MFVFGRHLELGKWCQCDLLLKSNVYFKAFNLSFVGLDEFSVCETKMAKEIKERKKRKRKWNRTIGILLFITVMGSLITLSALRQRASPPPPTPTLKPAREYFLFTDGFAWAKPLDEENSSIQVYQVGFKITAIGGNATNVHIWPRVGMVDLEETKYFDLILNGTSVEIGAGEITPFSYPASVAPQSEKGENGYPLSFRVASNEAGGQGEGGIVTVYVTSFIPYGPPGS